MLRSKATIIGRIALQMEEGKLTRLFLPCEAEEAPEPVHGSAMDSAFRQIEEYLAGERVEFDLPLAEWKGTPLQCRIASAIASIPYGHTATYGSLGFPRAVGRVCSMNPLPLIIPCHRVLPAITPPGQYRGGRHLKAWLLAMERNHLSPR